MKPFFTLLLFIFSAAAAQAQFTSPGTGITYTLAGLELAGAITNAGSFYFVDNDITISANDKLEILTDATLKFAANKAINIFGDVNIDPPGKVTFTAQNPAVSFNGIKLDGCLNAVIKKITFEYAVSFKVNNCRPLIDNSTFQFNNNNASTSFGNGAVSLFNGSPVITNCSFLNNQRAAIQGGSNISNAPQILNCNFAGNDISNANVPQINIGATGTDTARIIGNQIIGFSTKSGAIGFLPAGSVYAVIKNNVIKNNRYGVTFNGGNNINAMISYNVIENNNIEGLPLLGGSGINLTGGSAASHQNTIITGNYIKGNLWGVTIQGRSMPNLGNLSNADTSDDGKNVFIANLNAEPQSELYNSTADNISAQGNYWNTNDPAAIEAKIFHQPDNPAFGIVNYAAFVLPLRLTNFTARAIQADAVLNWSSQNEINTAGFEIQKSTDGQYFTAIGNIAAAGNTAAGQYGFTNTNAAAKNDRVYYRLKIVDLNGKFSYSPIRSVDFSRDLKFIIYPSPVPSGAQLHAEFISAKAQQISIHITDAAGRRVSTSVQFASKGLNRFLLNNRVTLPKGLLLIRFTGDDFTETQKVVVK